MIVANTSNATTVQLMKYHAKKGRSGIIVRIDVINPKITIAILK
jgi:hypothetical protein